MPIALKDIIIQMESLAPKEKACDWDNIGLLVGDPMKNIHKLLIALEVDISVAAEAMQLGCDLIITHHPLLFKPLKRVVNGDYVSDVLTQLIKNDIACYAAHTNLDNAALGVNYRLATALGLENISPLAEQDNNNPCFIGDLDTPCGWQELIEIVKESLGITFVKAVPQYGFFKKIAVCGGAGMDFWQIAKDAGADCLISSDSSYHQGIEAAHAGMALIDAGHYYTERLVLISIVENLQSKFNDLEIFASKIKTNPWSVF